MPFLIAAMRAYEDGQPLSSLANVGGHVEPAFVGRAGVEKEEILKEEKAACAQTLDTGHDTPNSSAIGPVPGPDATSRPPEPRPSPPGKGLDRPSGPNPPASCEEPCPEWTMSRHAEDMPGAWNAGRPRGDGGDGHGYMRGLCSRGLDRPKRLGRTRRHPRAVRQETATDQTPPRILPKNHPIDESWLRNLP